MTDPVPLRPGVQTNDYGTSPEALAISALLATGMFNPGAYHVSLDDLACYEQVFTFCEDYQARAGHGPAPDLVAKRYPDFTFTAGVDARWATAVLKEISWGRLARRSTSDALGDLLDGDIHGFRTKIRELVDTPVTPATSLQGVASFDPANVATRHRKIGIPTPYHTLTEVTDGIGADEMWLLAARLGHGKTMTATYFAAIAAECGKFVRYLSLEMPAHKINGRVLMHHARRDRPLLHRLRSLDEDTRAAAVGEIAERYAGYVETIDPSITPINVATIEQAMQGTDLLVIDHVGLLKDRKGRRAIDDWRVAAAISNEIRELNLRYHSSVLCVSQINRGGDRPGAMTPPKLSDVSQTDAFPQDADVGITFCQPSPSVHSFALGKWRDGEQRRWYSTFDPASGDFSEISKDVALALKLADDDRLGDA